MLKVLKLPISVNAVVLDKTGTITIGKPAVEEIEWRKDIELGEKAKILLAIQKNSEHPSGRVSCSIP